MVYNIKYKQIKICYQMKKKYYWKIKLQKEQESAGSNEKIKTPTLNRYM